MSAGGPMKTESTSTEVLRKLGFLETAMMLLGGGVMLLMLHACGKAGALDDLAALGINHPYGQNPRGRTDVRNAER
jgi:hypothetical protein